MKTTHLNYSRRPFTPITALLALWGRSRDFDPNVPFPVITAEQRFEHLNERHLASFGSICALENETALSPIYPLTLAYPILQRILCQKKAPLSMYVVLNSRIQILRLQPLIKGEPFSMHCTLKGFRVVPRGLEVFIHSVVESSRGLIWENRQTYYYRGHFGAAGPHPEDPVYEDLTNGTPATRWPLPKGTGFKFAKISGDGNPIHYVDFWARQIGFKQAFAQPLLVLGTAVDRLTRDVDPAPLYVDVSLKGPVFYGKEVMILKEAAGRKMRFDLFSQGNPRPCMRGMLATATQADRLTAMIDAN